MSDVYSILIWWLTFFIIGIIFLPTTILLFGKFYDKGYAFSKVIGVVLSSYVIWLLGSLHIVAFETISILLILSLAAFANYWILKALKKQGFSFSKVVWIWVFEEILFLTTLSAWSYIRGAEPSIRGLEKFMDFGFVNSILRSKYFPPQDMWLTHSPDYAPGSYINYYYFGHYINAFLTKLSGIDSAITYNLMIATLFAYTFTLPFSIGMNIYFLYKKAKQAMLGITNTVFFDSKLIAVGLLTAFLVSMAGNLHTIYIFTTGYMTEEPKPFWTFEFSFHPEKYWYPNATRFIPFTIHEFPIYSFVVADLHGHVSDIPMVLTVIALLLALLYLKQEGETAEDNTRETSQYSYQYISKAFEKHTAIPLHYLILLGLFLSIMWMTNAWDALIYLGLSALVFLYINFKNQFKSVLLSVYKTFSASLFLVFFFLISNIPFIFHFKPFVSGIGVLCAPKELLGRNIGPFLFEAGKCQKSPIWMLSLLWGFFYYNILGFFLFALFNRLRGSSKDTGKNLNTNRNWTPTLEKINIIHAMEKTDVFIMIMIVISTMLLVFPEFFYIKDIYPAHYRANTMFKLGYQAFMMLSIACAYIFYRISDLINFNLVKKIVDITEIKKIQPKFFSILKIWKYVFIPLFFLVAIYPYFAVNSYYNGLRTYQGLFGLNWLATQYPDDYSAIVWLRNNINCKGTAYCNLQPVIAEANGDSYTDYARVSANTGLPTIVGWPVHEWLWRGSYDEAGRRIPEVAAIYESTNLQQTRDILKKYNVEYIFVGTLEKQKYTKLNESKLNSLGKTVFESGKTKIIKVD